MFGIAGSNRISSDEEILAIVQARDSTKRFIKLQKSGIDKFVNNHVIFYDTAKIFFQFVKKRALESQLTIVIDNNFYKGYNHVNISTKPFFLPQSDLELARAVQLAQ